MLLFIALRFMQALKLWIVLSTFGIVLKILEVGNSEFRVKISPDNSVKHGH